MSSPFACLSACMYTAGYIIADGQVLCLGNVLLYIIQKLLRRMQCMHCVSVVFSVHSEVYSPTPYL